MLRLYAFLTDSTISLGPLVLSTFLLYLLTGIGAGSVFMIVLTWNDKTSRKIASDLITNALLIAILTWKFLPVLLSFKDIISNPLMILYASGGAMGMVLGAVFGIGYLVFKLFILGKNVDDGTPMVRAKNLLPLRGVIKPVLIFFATFAVVSSSLFLISGVVRNGGMINVSRGDRPVARTVGDIAPGFELYDTDGNIINLADFRGKWVILNFWATWCPPCLAEIPTLIKFYDRVDKEKVILLGINATGTEKSGEEGDVRSYISTFVKKKGITFPVLLDTCGDARSCVSTVYGAGNLPSTVVISPEGIITKVKTGVVDSFWLRSAVGGD